MIDEGFLFTNFRFSNGRKVVFFPGYFAFVVVIVAAAADTSVVVYVVAVIVVVIAAVLHKN